MHSGFYELGLKVKQSERLEMGQRPQGFALDYRRADRLDLACFANEIWLTGLAIKSADRLGLEVKK
jgi:hypothetical protein